MAAVQASSSSSDILASLNAQSRAGTSALVSTSEEVQNRFLKLLVTQLKNQDPLNPLDNAAVTTQISQINTVTGIERLNATLETLLSTYNDGQAVQAAALIGKSVLVRGSGLVLANGTASGGVNLAEPVDDVMLTILGAGGSVLQSQRLGARDAGSFAFSWDGKTAAGSDAPPGSYGFTVDAVRGGEKVAAETLQIGTVSALVREKSGFQLDLGGLGRVDFGKVQQIL
ncbi:MAG: flagellar hook assembly protein FlgD [Candidatus Accumulibacter sp.]|uniref:flagellar hook assembly protein FlgD n=1 Tax=Accumulibacter sp. TaxID=2053492 RepID=UPI001DFA067A|nr:flagellar hook assembly protein FlgD [Accumulibacter sp.]MCB1941504.1 flagellar hook assembly protein FlgD [Accumulibacter sp.]MCP5249177.1 flagellar hook assembly protein FlgD [Accumulibacter sp.]